MPMLPHTTLTAKANANQKCHACRITLKLFVSTLFLNLLVCTKILKYSTKLVAENAKAKWITDKLELNLKTQVGEKKNSLNYPILTSFKLAKDSVTRFIQPHQSAELKAKKPTTQKKLRQRNSPKVRNRKR